MCHAINVTDSIQHKRIRREKLKDCCVCSILLQFSQQHCSFRVHLIFICYYLIILYIKQPNILWNLFYFISVGSSKQDSLHCLRMDKQRCVTVRPSWIFIITSNTCFVCCCFFLLFLFCSTKCQIQVFLSEHKTLSIMQMCPFNILLLLLIRINWFRRV